MEEKPRKRKLKDAPKQPLSSYNIFVRERSKQIVLERPELKQQEVIKLISAEWRQLPKAEKEMYEEWAKNNREFYKKEKKGVNYYARLPKTDLRRVRNPFIVFCQEKLESIRKSSLSTCQTQISDEACFDVTSATKSIALEWRDLPAVEKKKYQLRYAAEKREALGQDELRERREFQKHLERSGGKPKVKRARTAFNFFTRDFMAKHKDLP